MLHKKSNLIKSILIAAFRKYDESEEREREKETERSFDAAPNRAACAIEYSSARISVKKAVYGSSVAQSVRFLPRDVRAGGEAGPR